MVVSIMKILLIILSAIVAIYLLDTIDNIIVNVTRIKHLGNLDLKHCPFCGEPINKEEKHKSGYIEKRHYLKLQNEFKMAPGDKLFFAGVRPDFAGKTTGKPSVETLRVDDRWGKTWNPVISFEK